MKPMTAATLMSAPAKHKRHDSADHRERKVETNTQKRFPKCPKDFVQKEYRTQESQPTQLNKVRLAAC